MHSTKDKFGRMVQYSGKQGRCISSLSCKETFLKGFVAGGCHPFSHLVPQICPFTYCKAKYSQGEENWWGRRTFRGDFGDKGDFFLSFFFPLQLEGLCYQRVVPQGWKQQGRKGKGLWVIPWPLPSEVYIQSIMNLGLFSCLHWVARIPHVFLSLHLHLPASIF